MQNLPNILTSLRLASPCYFIGVLVIFNDQQIQSQILFYIFLVLSISDYLDGYFARKLNITSNFGKVFDPISDKILTSSALLFLSSIDNMVLLPSILIIFREFLISGIREFSLIKINKNVNVTSLSKIKTTLQFFILSFLLILYSSHNRLFFNEEINIEKLIYFCIWGLWLVTFLTLYTGFQYCYMVFQNNKVGTK
jgi:cardiolipin synthase